MQCHLGEEGEGSVVGATHGGLDLRVAAGLQRAKLVARECQDLRRIEPSQINGIKPQNRTLANALACARVTASLLCAAVPMPHIAASSSEQADGRITATAAPHLQAAGAILVVQVVESRIVLDRVPAHVVLARYIGHHHQAVCIAAHRHVRAVNVCGALQSKRWDLSPSDGLVYVSSLATLATTTSRPAYRLMGTCAPLMSIALCRERTEFPRGKISSPGIVHTGS